MNRFQLIAFLRDEAISQIVGPIVGANAPNDLPLIAEALVWLTSKLPAEVRMAFDGAIFELEDSLSLTASAKEKAAYLEAVKSIFVSDLLAPFYASVDRAVSLLIHQNGLTDFRATATRAATNLWDRTKQRSYDIESWQHDRVELAALCFVASGAKMWVDRFLEEVRLQLDLYKALPNETPVGTRELLPSTSAQEPQAITIEQPTDPRNLTISLDRFLACGLKTSPVGTYNAFVNGVVNGKPKREEVKFDTPSLDEVCKEAGLYNPGTGKRKPFKKPARAPGRARAVLDLLRDWNLLTGMTDEFIRELSNRYALDLEGIPQSTEAQKSGQNKVYAAAKRNVEQLLKRWEGHCPDGGNYEKIGQ